MKLGQIGKGSVRPFTNTSTEKITSTTDMIARMTITTQPSKVRFLTITPK